MAMTKTAKLGLVLLLLVTCVFIVNRWGRSETRLPDNIQNGLDVLHDAKPAGAGIDQQKCKSEVKHHCKNECIQTSETPADRPQCEVACMSKPLSAWNGIISECTPGL